jgi:hypothetical protein
MRQRAPEKLSIAWFKLAQCIARGEKERALAVYRLLIHSFDDPALALQLEGDIFFAFDDEIAFEKYLGAVARYRAQGRREQARAVCEHVLALLPITSPHALPFGLLREEFCAPASAAPADASLQKQIR